MNESYDLIILGGGPAGLAAGIYGGRARLRTLLLEKGSIGGRAYTTREIVNYPGTLKAEGPQLMAQMEQHARQFQVEIRKEAVKSVELSGPLKTIRTRRHTYEAPAVILATGTSARVLGIPGEKEYTGMGVAYCATCDAQFFENETVVVLGSGDQAIEESIFIAKYAKEVIIVVLHDEGILDCNKISAAQAFAHPKLRFLWNSTIAAVEGDDNVTGVKIKNTQTGALSDLPCQGVFFFVGMVPQTSLFEGQIDLNAGGWVLTNERMETSLPGVYAAGDLREKYLRQIATSISDGAIAATAAEKYLEEMRGFEDLVKNADQPVILEFWNPQLSGALESISLLNIWNTQHGAPYQLMEIDITRKPHLAARYGIRLTEDTPAAAVMLQGGAETGTILLSPGSEAALSAWL